MKRILIFIFGLLFIVSLYAAEIETLYIVHTNDLHSHLQRSGRRAGFARIAAFIAETRRKHKNVLVLDAGDVTTGTPVCSMFRGVPGFEIMAHMGYDAMTLGNHEFDFSWKQIEKYKDIIPFPVICANALTTGGKLIADCPWKIFDINGIKVGVIGIVSEKLPDLVAAGHLKGMYAAPEIATIQKYLPELKNKCDIVIALTHIGKKNDIKLAQTVRGIDLIVGGHSHSKISAPLKINNTYIVQDNCYGMYVGLVKAKIDLNNHKIVSLTGMLVPPAQMPPPDENIQKQIEQWEEKVRKEVDIRIGTGSHTFTESELKDLFEKILKERTKADFGYYNLGGIRDRLYRGPIYKRSIWNIEPFNNRIAILTIEGRNIGGSLLRRLRRDNVKIDPNRKYTVATNSYIASHHDPERFTGKAASINYTPLSVRETVIEYISKRCAGNKQL